MTLGFLYAFTDQNDLASHELETALRLDKFNAAAYGALAELQTRQGRTELVEATLQKAVSLAPDDWLLNMQLGAHYLDGGKWAQAGEQFRHAVELVPDNPRAYNNLGLVYRGLGRLDDSAAAFQKAIDLEPTFIHFRNLGMVLAEAGKYSEAAQALQAIDRACARINIARGGCSRPSMRTSTPTRRRSGTTYLKAIALAADLLKETPKDEYLLADVGGYYAALGKEKESLPLLAQAAALAPDIPEVLYQVAVGYEMLHHRDEALRWLAKARAEWLSFRGDCAKSAAGCAARRSAVRVDRRREPLTTSTLRRRFDDQSQRGSRVPAHAQEEDRQEEGCEEVVSRGSGKRVFNCIESHDQHEDWSLEKAKALGLSARKKKIPAAKDLREPWWNIGNQGATGSCVGWAFADSVLRYHFVKVGKAPEARAHFGPLHLDGGEGDGSQVHVSDDVPR